MAIVGAGGIGFDVAEFLAHENQKGDYSETFFREWGVDTGYAQPGGLKAPEMAPARRSLHLLQRKASKVGAQLGTTTGWIHRNSLKARGVQMQPGVSYRAIDDKGLHIETSEGKATLEVDTIVICAGQDPERTLAHELEAAGHKVHLIGGADVAAELDAKRAINQGTTLAASL